MRTRTLLLALALVALLGPAPAGGQPLSLVVNLPAYRLEVVRGDERIRTYPIGIGSPRYPSPMGEWEVGFVEWNPWWNPPPSPWARGERRTPPGPGNPMGRAKIGFLPLFYLHGSPSGVGRASSHGCIRMNNADVLDLARLIALETGALDEREIGALERSSRRTRRVELPEPVTVRIVYRLAEEVDGRVLVHEDVYDMGMTSRERELARRAGRPTP